MTKMKMLFTVAIVAVVVAALSIPAQAQDVSRQRGPVGWRVLPYNQGTAYYCDNFYDGPPTATTPSGQPRQGTNVHQVYWCYSETKSYWIPTSPSI